MKPTNLNTFWRTVAEITLGLVDQHKYTWSMMWGRLPVASHSHMVKGDHVLMRLKSDLENEMFSSGGPRDIRVFYPGQNREPGKRYPQTTHSGGRYPALTAPEWQEIGIELEQCLSLWHALVDELLLGGVSARRINQALKYRDVVLRVQRKLEPYAIKQTGDRSVLYPDTGQGLVSTWAEGSL